MFTSDTPTQRTGPLIVLNAAGDVLVEGVGLGERGDRGGVGGGMGIFLGIVA